MLVVPNEGELILLAWMLRDGPQSVHLHLYRNDYSPTRDCTVLDFLEANFVDYSALSLSTGDWTDPALSDGAGVTYWGTSFQTWATSGTSQVIYGYYVTTTDNLTVLWAERFAAAQTVSTTNPVLLRPVMRLHSEVEPV